MAVIDWYSLAILDNLGASDCFVPVLLLMWAACREIVSIIRWRRSQLFCAEIIGAITVFSRIPCSCFRTSFFSSFSNFGQYTIQTFSLLFIIKRIRPRFFLFRRLCNNRWWRCDVTRLDHFEIVLRSDRKNNSVESLQFSIVIKKWSGSHFMSRLRSTLCKILITYFSQHSHWIISYTAAWILDNFLLQCHITAPVELFTLGCLRWERFGKRLLMRSYGVTWCFWLWMWVEILSCGSRVSDCAGLRSSKKTSICTGKISKKRKNPNR